MTVQDMTEQEAINILEKLICRVMAYSTELALKKGIQALEEVEQYRVLGTVEELKEAREKQIPKKPNETEHFNCLNYECPICEGGLYHEQQYCDECGQALKWGEEDEAVPSPSP